MNDATDTREVWEPSLATRLLGKVILAGITYYAEDGSTIEHQQFYGTVSTADPGKGILLSLLGRRSGETYNLPPDTRSIEVASPGNYRLRATGEVVVDPHYTVMFGVHKQPGHSPE